MLESFQSNTARDFRQRYQNSWGYYTIPETQRRILVYMNTVNEHKVDFTDAAGVVYHANADQGVEFEFIPVEKKLFVYKDNLYFIRRNPARMWSRGVNSQNTRVNKIGQSDTYLTFDLIKAAFETPAAEVNKEKPAYILSETFGVQDKVLYVYNEKIGVVEGDVFKLETQLFKQELLDRLRQLNLAIEVQIG